MATAAIHPALRGRWAGAVALVALVLLAYYPALRAGFVWDDDLTLTQNRFLQEPGGRGLHELWLTTRPPDYWPVTSTVFWLEWRLWGANPLGYHIVNLGLHIAGVILLWILLLRLGIPGAWLGATLFAVHPVNVESVAWIAELKNLMAMLFYLLSAYFFLLGAQLGREKPPSSPPAGPLVLNWWYWLSFLCFVLAMLSKGSVAILPVVLLGIVAWRRRVGWRDVLRLTPFFAVAAMLTWVNVWFQGHHLAAGEAVRAVGPLRRLLGAGAVVWFYLSKAICPFRLAFFYPQWRIDPAQFLWWLPLVAAVVVTGVLFKADRVAFRPVLFAWLYFCAALIPVMGLTDVYFMRYSLVADHYQHLALIGVTALAGTGWSHWRRWSRMADWAAGILVGALVLLTFHQGLAYRDAESLLRRSLSVNPRSAAAQNNLGVILAGRRDWPEAEARFGRAVDLAPDFAEAQRNLGLVLDREGRWSEAIPHYQEALRLESGPPGAPQSMDSILLRLQLEDAQRRAQAARAEGR